MITLVASLPASGNDSTCADGVCASTQWPCWGALKNKLALVIGENQVVSPRIDHIQLTAAVNTGRQHYSGVWQDEQRPKRSRGINLWSLHGSRLIAGTIRPAWCRGVLFLVRPVHQPTGG